MSGLRCPHLCQMSAALKLINKRTINKCSNAGETWVRRYRGCDVSNGGVKKKLGNPPRESGKITGVHQWQEKGANHLGGNQYYNNLQHSWTVIWSRVLEASKKVRLLRIQSSPKDSIQWRFLKNSMSFPLRLNKLTLLRLTNGKILEGTSFRFKLEMISKNSNVFTDRGKGRLLVKHLLDAHLLSKVWDKVCFVIVY